MKEELDVLFLTLKLAVLTSAILLFIALPLSNWLAKTRNKIKNLIDPIVNLPLILPPSVMGFYLLLAFSPAFFLGKVFEEIFGYRLAFSFTGILIASVISSLPFMIQPILAALENLNPIYREVSYTMGKSKLRTFINIELPLIRSSLFRAIIMTFCHTIGNFGVILMVGGAIPSVTKVASIAIYNEVESGSYNKANFYSLTLLIISFLSLFILSWMNYREHRRKYD